MFCNEKKLYEVFLNNLKKIPRNIAEFFFNFFWDSLYFKSNTFKASNWKFIEQTRKRFFSSWKVARIKYLLQTEEAPAFVSYLLFFVLRNENQWSGVCRTKSERGS